MSKRVTNEMLEAAMKKAVELGIFPKFSDQDTYLKHWAAMKETLQAAMDTEQ